MNVSALALPPKIKFKSKLGVFGPSNFFWLIFGQNSIYTYGAIVIYPSPSLSGLLWCLDDITPWRTLQPILSCSCFVFSSARGLSQMEAAVGCMPQKAGNSCNMFARYSSGPFSSSSPNNPYSITAL